jgi:hypothetical protein
MAAPNFLFGGAAAVAGLGGLAAAALTTQAGHGAAQSQQPIETRTVVVRTVEHRIVRLKARHSARGHHAAAPRTAAPPPAPPSAPPTTFALAPAATPTAPLRTRASGGGGDDSGSESARSHENEPSEAQDD